jgi:hypothetical protein
VQLISKPSTINKCCLATVTVRRKEENTESKEGTSDETKEINSFKTKKQF